MTLPAWLSAPAQWLALCLLAWLAAQALTGTARLLAPAAPVLAPTTVTLDPAALPPVPTAWQQQAAEADTRIPLTDLPYRVVGRALSESDANSLVVLATPDGQRALMPGDRIAANITLARIDDEGVVLSRAGRLERLPWPEPTAAPSGGISPAASTTAATASSSTLSESSP
ncbi:type II secretion system protein N [Salinicola endophyticus]|uniref:type II secretion system protein N n=1 Tax=Salinicola endophyticus TaxID=1949083 RepID=UPI000DA20882|nr:type II secretion system protein N [Salinicola endophyticus]